MYNKMEEKTCIGCQIPKKLTEFYKNGNYYKSKCKECDKKHNKDYVLINKEKHKNRCLDWQEKNSKKQAELNKKSFNKLKQDPNWLKNKYNKNTEYHKEKYKIDPIFKIKKLLRNRFNSLINNKSKSNLILEYLGCTLEELKIYLESLFLPEMNWENHGKIWEIDHIKACDKFNLIKIEEQKRCFHYTNLQPLFSTTKIAESFGYKNYIGNREKWNK